MEQKQRQNSVLSLGILIAGLLLVYALVIMPAIDKRKEYRQQIEELQFQYTRFDRLVSQRDDIRKQLKQLKQQQADTTGFLKDKPESLAAADLQNYIKNIIESKGGNLISTQVIQHESNTTFPDVRVRIQMRSGMQALQGVLYALESGQPTLLLDNVYLQKRNTRISRRPMMRSRANNEVDLIEARFEVTGFIYQSKAPPKS